MLNTRWAIIGLLASFVAVPAVAANGHRDSAPDMRSEIEIQRSINRDKRIADGIRDGSLSAREAEGLERGPARMEQRIQRSEDRQGRRNFRQ